MQVTMQPTQRDGKACDTQTSCSNQMIGTDLGMLSNVTVTVMGISICALYSTVGNPTWGALQSEYVIRVLSVCDG